MPVTLTTIDRAAPTLPVLPVGFRRMRRIPSECDGGGGCLQGQNVQISCADVGRLRCLSPQAGVEKRVS